MALIRDHQNLSYNQDISGSVNTATTTTSETKTTHMRVPRQGARIYECGFNVFYAGSGPRSITANWYEKGLSTNTLATGPTWTDDDMDAGDEGLSHRVKGLGSLYGSLEGNPAITTGARIDIQFTHGAEAQTTPASYIPYIVWAL